MMVSVGKSVTVMCGILFLFIGNMIPKAKSNFYLGIKTPWALSDDENWRRTNRLGGKMLFTAGGLSIAAPFFLDGKYLGIVFFTVVMAACIIPCAMSYIWWRQKETAR